MLINAKNLNEVIPHKVYRIKQDERFYSVPGASEYIMSTYGRLYRMTNGRYLKQKMNLFPRDSYRIKFDSDNKKTSCSVGKLMSLTFFPGLPIRKLVNPEYNPFGSLRWDITKLMVLENRDEVVEYLSARIEHREPTYKDYTAAHGFINRYEADDFHKILADMYHNMVSRATNQKTKALHPTYINTTIDDQWLGHRQTFYDWCKEHIYYYPGDIQLDKDILGFGETDKYSPETCCFIPSYINNIFVFKQSKLGYGIHKEVRKNGELSYITATRKDAFGEYIKPSYCKTYVEALSIARKHRADFIRSVVKKERDAGYMPEYILQAMEEWARLCENGLIKEWEPDINTLIEEGII